MDSRPISGATAALLAALTPAGNRCLGRHLRPKRLVPAIFGCLLLPSTASADGTGASSSVQAGVQEPDDFYAGYAAMTCDNPAMQWLREAAWESANKGFVDVQLLGEWCQELWLRWLEFGPASGSPMPLGLRGAVGQIIGRREALGPNGDGAAAAAADQLPEGYCLPGHLLAGFLGALSLPWTYAERAGRAKDPDYAVERHILQEADDWLRQSYMFVGYNRFADNGKLAGWPVGAGEILEAQDALRRACPQAQDIEDIATCTTGSLEAELARGFAGSIGQVLLPGPAAHAGPRTFTDSFRYRQPALGSCRERSVAGGGPCRVQVWYLGTHEALFKEVEHQWHHAAPEEFKFEFARVNAQGIYNPASHDVRRPSERKGLEALDWLGLKLTGEDDVDIQPSIARFIELMGIPDLHDGYDAVMCLCTIPAEVCSVFGGVKWPVVMYAANPATAQVPISEQPALLQRLSAMAAEPKNIFLVSNPYAQAQFEYQLGINLPAIRVHGLYTGICREEGPVARGSEFLVYDRANPLFARVLEALRRHSVPEPEKRLPSAFVHIADTDRKYSTFAEFGAVVFAPGDVEQMAFYEFYSMNIPVFVPADPGRFMWPRMPGFSEKSCGEFESWLGTWQMQFKDIGKITLRIDCSGKVSRLTDEGDVAAQGQLTPLRLLDSFSMSHCALLIGDQRSGHLQTLKLRMRVLREYMNVAHLKGGGSSCVGDFTDAGDDVRGKSGGYSVMAVGQRVPWSEEPVLRTQWDHDIFASTSWYLDTRLPGKQRTRYSPFAHASFDAIREWAHYIDYFRFPSVGLFVSFAQLQALLAESGLQGLSARSRAMRAFNDEGLRHTRQQWRAVLSMAVADEKTAQGEGTA